MKFGYFDDAKKEYVITSPRTPLPWINYLGSKDFFSLISNTCGGYSFYKDAKLLRLTRYRYILKSATVKEFFDAVKVQTGLNFIYSTEQVKNMPRITIQSNSQPISEVLNKVLANTGYSYEIEGNIVTIVYQQPKENVRTATGVVVDEGGLPLPGAYIKLSKTEHSTITDNEGKFSINLFHQKEPVLIVSYLGMIVQEVKVAGTKPMTIVMKSDVKSIDEVVVTGYQEIDRRKLASSISSIKGADLIGGEYLSIDKMLQGRLPGVAVMNMSSTPGAAPKIRIRGSSSITDNPRKNLEET